jgi:hypothetical protein
MPKHQPTRWHPPSVPAIGWCMNTVSISSVFRETANAHAIPNANRYR